jgi:ribosomal protein L29
MSPEDIEAVQREANEIRVISLAVRKMTREEMIQEIINLRLTIADLRRVVNYQPKAKPSLWTTIKRFLGL